MKKAVMSEKQFNEYLTAIREGGKEIGATKESARAFFVRAGIVDENGHLTEPYRQPDVHTTSQPNSGLPRV